MLILIRNKKLISNPYFNATSIMKALIILAVVKFIEALLLDLALTYSPCLKTGDSWIQTILAY
nr:MAG TPA: hypothetical protein [Bacteriophage sp.]